ncbi:UNVERIFIED_CONTAM: hypothetical protein GTU68_066724 [Idotea baltica]|nr:hypothetical protein [Idotea baltica]
MRAHSVRPLTSWYSPLPGRKLSRSRVLRRVGLFWAAQLLINCLQALCLSAKKASCLMLRSALPIRSNMALMKWKFTRMPSRLVRRSFLLMI